MIKERDDLNWYGCAQGWHTVPKDLIRTWPKAKAKRFLYEMMTRGGRISHYGYEWWCKELGLEV